VSPSVSLEVIAAESVSFVLGLDELSVTVEMLGALLPMVTEEEAVELDEALPSLATTLHRTTSPLLCRLGPRVELLAEIAEPPIVQA
jgi:hypothetical protein